MTLRATTSKLRSAAFTAVMALGACTDEAQSEAAATPATSSPTPAATSAAAPTTPAPRSGTGLLPPVESFVAKHKEFAPVTNAQPNVPWAYGDRQVADTAKGPAEIYVQGGEVVTVWKRDHSAKLWEKAGYKVPGAVDKTARAVAGSAAFPAYTIIETMKLMSGGRQGSVLVTSFNKKTSLADREALLRHVMSAEGLIQANLYCSKDAYQADMSEKFAKAHPRARDCNLGAIIDDKLVTLD